MSIYISFFTVEIHVNYTSESPKLLKLLRVLLDIARVKNKLQGCQYDEQTHWEQGSHQVKG
jgi:hypothetical protein